MQLHRRLLLSFGGLVTPLFSEASSGANNVLGIHNSQGEPDAVAAAQAGGPGRLIAGLSLSVLLAVCAALSIPQGHALGAALLAASPSVPILFHLLTRAARRRLPAHRASVDAKWNELIDRLNEQNADDESLEEGWERILDDQDGDRETQRIASAALLSKQISGTRQAELRLRILELGRYSSDRMDSLGTALTAAGGALIFVALGNVGEATHSARTEILWAIAFAGLAVAASFAARFLRMSAWAGVIGDLDYVARQPNWKDRAHGIFALPLGDEYRRPIWVIELVLFQLSLAVLASSLVLTTVSTLP